jgi:hypothetical protein
MSTQSLHVKFGILIIYSKRKSQKKNPLAKENMWMEVAKLNQAKLDEKNF